MDNQNTKYIRIVNYCHHVLILVLMDNQNTKLLQIPWQLIQLS